MYWYGESMHACMHCPAGWRTEEDDWCCNLHRVQFKDTTGLLVFLIQFPLCQSFVVHKDGEFDEINNVKFAECEGSVWCSNQSGVAAT